MKFIEEFKENDRIVEHYLCKQKQSLKSRAGKTYLSIKLQDKTGTIDAKVWELNNDIENFEENDFIKIDALVNQYQNDFQLKINKIRKSESWEYNPSDYIPCTDKDIEGLYGKIKETINSLSSTYVKQLLENIFVKNSEISKLFISHSAAKHMHHSYMGGLLEHTLNVVEICDFLGSRYRHVNRDILIAGAMLHDVGKIFELSPFPTNDYTDDGQLLGHITMCVELIEKTASNIEGFPHELKSMIKHCILAHHGEYEYGSPKRPKTIEAFILHVADNGDAKIRMIEETLDNDKTNGNWVGYHKMLARNIRKSEYSDKE